MYLYDTYSVSAVIYLLIWDEHWENAEAKILYIILAMTYIHCLHGCQLLRCEYYLSNFFPLSFPFMLLGYPPHTTCLPLSGYFY